MSAPTPPAPSPSGSSDVGPEPITTGLPDCAPTEAGPAATEDTSISPTCESATVEAWSDETEPIDGDLQTWRKTWVVAAILGLAGIGVGAAVWFGYLAWPRAGQSDSPSAPATTISAQTTSVTPATPEGQSAQRPNLKTYVAQYGITLTPVHRGDPGSPTIKMAIPLGWGDAEGLRPAHAYSAISYLTAEDFRAQPAIIANLLKVTPNNVNTEEFLEVIGANVYNSPDFKPVDPGTKSSLDGYPAFQVSGTVTVASSGETVFNGLKDVAIPSGANLYLLEFVATSRPDESEILTAAMNVVFEQTTITL